MYLAFELFINCIDVIIALYAINSTLITKDINIKIISAMTFTVAFFILTIFTIGNYNSNITIVIFLIYILYSFLFFKDNYVLKLLIPLLVFFIFNLSELFTISIVTSYLNIKVDHLVSDNNIRITLMFVTRILIFLLIFSTSFIYNKKLSKDSFENNSKHIYVYILIPLSSIISMIFILRHYLIVGSSNIYMLVVAITLFSINIISFIQTRILISTLTRKYQYDILLKENELKTELYDRTIRSYNHLKGWKHDIKFHLNTLGHLVSNKSYTQLGDYIKNIGYDLDNKIIIVNTGNIYLDSTISDFISKSNSLNVPVNIELEVPDISYIENFDLCSLFGNITSNALEAVQKTDDKRISLSITLLPNKMIRIICENTFDGEIKLDNTNILSRKGGTNHGYGLKNIKKIVNKYDGLMNVNYTDMAFRITILIPTVNPQDKKIYIYNNEV